MKIVKLTLTSAEPIKAQAYRSNRTSKMYFNIKHGSSGTSFGYWLGRVSPKVGVPKDLSDVLTLDKDNYVLIPNRTDGIIQKDKLGNNIYTIGIDFNTIHSRDVLVFWEIPNKNYTDVTVYHKGEVNLIGMAYSGRDRGDKIYKSPAPVLEIYGDCILYWTGHNVNGDIIKQEIIYDYIKREWDVKPITILPNTLG